MKSTLKMLYKDEREVVSLKVKFPGQTFMKEETFFHVYFSYYENNTNL